MRFWFLGCGINGELDDCDSEEYDMGRDEMREVRMMCVGLKNGVV